MVKNNITANLRQIEAGRRVFRRRVQNVAQPRHRNPHLLKILPQLRQPYHRRRHLPGQHIKSNQLPHRQPALNHQLRAKIQRGNRHRLLNELNPLLTDGSELGHAETRLHITRQLLVPAPRHLRLDRHRLDRPQRRHRLHQKRLIVRIAGKLLVQPRAQHRGNQRRPGGIHRQRHHHNQRQPAAVKPHHRNKNERKEQIQHRSQRLPGEKISNLLQLAHPRHRIANAALLKITDRQLQQMAVKPRAQLHINAAGSMRKHIRTQPAQHHLKNRHHHKSDGNHIKRTETTMHQHLVHHHLKKERSNQRE